MEPTKIIIIDDDVDLTTLVSSVLEMNDFNTTVFNDPEEALGHILNNNYNLIVVDLMMPKITGIELLQKLRQSEHHTNTPVIVLSAIMEEKEELKQLGIKNYLVKPFRADDLVKKVRVALSEQ